MLGYKISVMQIDREIEEKLDAILPGDRVDSDFTEYRQLMLAHWSTSGYPKWPDNLVEEGVATVQHNNVLNSTYLLPLKYVLTYLSHDMKHDGPTIIQDSGITEPGDLIGPEIHHDRIARCDPEETVEIDRWDQS